MFKNFAVRSILQKNCVSRFNTFKAFGVFNTQNVSNRQKHIFVYMEEEKVYLAISEEEVLKDVVGQFKRSFGRQNGGNSFLSRNLMHQNRVLSYIVDKAVIDDIEEVAQGKSLSGSIRCDNHRPQILIRRNNSEINRKFLKTHLPNSKDASSGSDMGGSNL